MLDHETLAYQHQNYYKTGQQCREFNMDKNQRCDNAVDEDYTFSFATMNVQGEHTNDSPQLFRTRSNSISLEELSPADSFFSNGQLLPHSFPSIVSKINISRAPSDLSTKEFTSSSLRNSSINSSSSSRNSSINSGSRNSRQNSSPTSSRVKKQVSFAPEVAEPSGTQLKSPWQSRRGVAQSHKRYNGEKKEIESKSWVGKIFFCPLVSACRECHALEPSNLPVNPRVK